MPTFALFLIVVVVGPLSVECGLPEVRIDPLDTTVVGETIHFECPPERSVDVFKGIPYAEPPDRFARPQPKQSWPERLDATEYGSDCAQLSFRKPLSYIGSEDCLYLNIWTPHPKPQKAAVMVFIHGGAFQSEAGRLYKGDVLTACNDVILVTFNYRLSVLGFVSAGDSELPGNYGLWDQVAALEWVSKYIDAFGGDPDRVTIFGQSAGAASVSLMTLAKPSWSYYSKAIMESGTALSGWGFEADKSKMRSDAFRLGKWMHCDLGEDPDSRKLADCLKKAPLSKMLHLTLLMLPANVIPFIPTVDDDLLPAAPATLYEEGDFNQVDVLLGTDRDEGVLPFVKAYCAGQIRNCDKFRNLSQTLFDEKLSSYVYLQHDDETLQVIKDSYVNDLGPYDSYFWPFVRITTDEGFICPTDAVAKAFAKAGRNTYVYQMTLEQSSWIPHWTDIVGHGDEVRYVFGDPLRPASLTAGPTPEQDIIMTINIMRYWTNFAKTGNPNLEGVPETKKWAKFDTKNYYYKDLSPEMPDRMCLKQDKCYLWNQLLPEIVRSRLFTGGLNPDIVGEDEREIALIESLLNKLD